MAAYYNEIDPFAAQWMRNLIAARMIAPGDVDERDIRDVCPSDLAGYRQCHFFAGIGVWSYALRRAGWDDDRAIWTGSCPCQPFSAAGCGAGFADERHLWPAFFHLIRECRPGIVAGEQVASKDAEPWVDLVCADVEAVGYAFGAVPFPAAGVGAPHIRDRLYWLAYADHDRLEGRGQALPTDERRRLAHEGEAGFNGLGHACGSRLSLCERSPVERAGWRGEGGATEQPGGASDALSSIGHNSGAGPVNSVWQDADWLRCRDGRWRPVEPGAFPLADGAANRVGRLRGAGNAIVAPAAQAFISALMDCRP